MDIKGGVEKFVTAVSGNWQTPTAPVTFAQMTNTPTGKDFTSVETDCDECGKPINLDEDNYCTGHEKKCPNYGLEEQAVNCECSIFYHDMCCPICMNIERVIREYEQHQH